MSPNTSIPASSIPSEMNLNASGKSSSDTVLLTVAVIAVVVSLLGLILTYTNVFAIQQVLLAPTDTGDVDVEIVTSANILFTLSSIDWGQGFVDTAFTSATLDSEGTTTNFLVQDGSGEIAGVTDGFVVQNVGNTDVSLELASDVDGEGFIGPVGSAVSDLNYKVGPCIALDCSGANNGLPGAVNTPDTGTSCTDTTTAVGFGPSYVDVNTAGNGNVVCDRFEFEDANDELRIDVQVIIDRDATAGQKSAVFTARATANP